MNTERRCTNYNAPLNLRCENWEGHLGAHRAQEKNGTTRAWDTKPEYRFATCRHCAASIFTKDYLARPTRWVHANTDLLACLPTTAEPI